MRLFVISRHGESTLNIENRVNGDPNVPVELTEAGRDEARLLGQQIAHIPIDVCFHSRFSRTFETARIALGNREVPFVAEPLLDDIDVGDLEGQTLDDYRAWKRTHSRSDTFPGGESLDDAARRYARAFEAVLARGERTILIVAHEIPLRYASNVPLRRGGAVTSSRPDREARIVGCGRGVGFGRKEQADAVDRATR